MNESKRPLSFKLFTIWRSAYPLLIYLAWSFAVSFALSFIGSFILMYQSRGAMDPLQMSTELTEFLYRNMIPATIVTQLLTLPFVIWFYRRDKKKNPANTRKNEIRPLDTVLVVVLGISCCISLNGLIGYSHLSDLFPGFSDISPSLYKSSMILQIISMVILAPIVEELLCRILCFDRLKEAFKPVTAMILSSLFFGLLHMNVVQGVYAFGIGMCFVLVYEKTRRIYIPMLAHGVANAMSVLIARFSGERLFNLPLSIEIFVVVVCTIVLIGCITYFIRIRRNPAE